MAAPFNPERLRAEHPDEDPDDIGIVGSFEDVLALTRPRIWKRYQEATKRRIEYAKAEFHIPQSLIIVGGHEGSGKTRVTKRKLELWTPRMVVIEKDPISNKFSTGRSDRKDPAHAAMRPMVYDAMNHFADEVLQAGGIPALDAPFNKFDDFFHNSEWEERMRALAAKNGADVKVVWCEASPETRYQRIVARGAAQDVERSEEQKRALAARTDRPETGLPFFVFNTEDSPGAGEHSTEGLKAFLGAAPIVGIMPMDNPRETIPLENAHEESTVAPEAD